MENFYSKIDGRLLHMVIRKEDFEAQRTDVVTPDNFIQLSVLNMKNGVTFKPHKHFYKPGAHQAIAQESWVVISGKVRCCFYDTDDTLLWQPVLNPGDVSVTLHGGHTYEILEDNTRVYEYKTGPYTGQINDKVFI